jgi:hypothetical protein
MALKDQRQTDLPTREEFIAFWRVANRTSWRRILPHLIYLSGLATYAVIVRAVASRLPGILWVVYLQVAVAYIVLTPYLWERHVWRRDARFLRCAQCGQWLGRTIDEALNDSNLKWKSICETGVCHKCGRRLLASENQQDC